MKNLTRKMFIIILVLSIVISSTTTVFAEPDIEEINMTILTSDNNLLEKTLTDAFNTEEKNSSFPIFKYSDGTKVENIKVKKIIDMYKNDEVKDIQHFLLEEKIVISYTIDRQVSKIDKNGLKGPYQEITVTRSEIFYHIATDTSGNYTKEWTVIIEGTFTYENLENQILTAENPSISIGTASFGSAFSPYMGNVVTYTPTIDYTSVNFSAKHTMYADLYLYNVYVGTYNFGTYTDEFTETP